MRRRIEIAGSALGVVIVDGEIPGDHFARLTSRLDFRVRLSKRPDLSPYWHSTNFGLEDDPILCGIRQIVAELWPAAEFVHGNLAMNSHGETLAIHRDSISTAKFEQAEVTALYYANPEWPPDWHGETLFYEDGEPRHCVLPRPGRLVVFDPRIRHCGTLPTRQCFAPRVVVAAVFRRKK